MKANQLWSRVLLMTVMFQFFHGIGVFWDILPLALTGFGVEVSEVA